MPSSASFLLRRSLSSDHLIVGTVTLVFLILYWLPGDPAELVAGENATPESVARIRALLGTDQPLWVQYFAYVGHLARGDLGTSFATQEPVSLRLWAQFPATIGLTLLASAVAIHGLVIPSGVEMTSPPHMRILASPVVWL